MYKILIKICITLLVFAMLVSARVFSSTAAICTNCKGDIDFDGKIVIDDATLLQKYLADLAEFN